MIRTRSGVGPTASRVVLVGARFDLGTLNVGVAPRSSEDDEERLGGSPSGPSRLRRSVSRPPRGALIAGV